MQSTLWGPSNPVLRGEASSGQVTHSGTSTHVVMRRSSGPEMTLRHGPWACCCPVGLLSLAEIPSKGTCSSHHADAMQGCIGMVPGGSSKNGSSIAGKENRRNGGSESQIRGSNPKDIKYSLNMSSSENMNIPKKKKYSFDPRHTSLLLHALVRGYNRYPCH